MRSVPRHHRASLSKHLDLTRREGVIKDMDFNKPIYCALNVVITEKKTPGEIGMNIHITPINKGA